MKKDYDYNAHKKAQFDEIDRILDKLKKIRLRQSDDGGKEKLVRCKQKDNKMEHIGKIVAYLILAINAFFVGTLILSAYSPYLNPKLNPLSSGLGLAFPLFLVINIAFIIFWVFINYRYALVPLIGFLVCFPQIRTYIPFNSTTKTIPEGSIKILSYNVMNFSNLEKERRKESNLIIPG